MNALCMFYLQNYPLDFHDIWYWRSNLILVQCDPTLHEAQTELHHFHIKKATRTKYCYIIFI